MELTLKLSPDTLSAIHRIASHGPAGTSEADVIKRALQLGLQVLSADDAPPLRDGVTDAVMAFARENGGESFRMVTLQTAVQASVPGASPDSASRLLRQLKSQGMLDYRLDSRAESRYTLLWAQGSAKAPPP